MGKRYWEDLVLGDGFTCGPVAFDREGILEYGRRYDPWPFHTDEAAAEASIFSGLVASSFQIVACCTRAVVEAHGERGELAVLSGLGVDEVRLLNPVRPGDDVTVEARWTELRRSRSKPDRGIAILSCRAVNQRGEPVLEYGYRYLLACRTEG
ncbi:MAG: hypothetical protein H6Q84_3199 [Deltaproteobacteria bacterium]|nr:hypothetical protein [Deltaproteobacteria bacterium]